MEWKPQYLFLIHELNSGTYFRLLCCVSGECCLHIAFFTFRVVSRISHSCVLWSETQARCSSFCRSIGCVIVGTALCLLHSFQRAQDMDGGDGGGRGMFVLFLVQYAVHKSLALEILQFLLISFVVKWVHCCFFFIKTLLTIEMACASFLLRNTDSKNI